MTTEEKLAKVLALVKSLAEKQCWADNYGDDDFCIYDMSGSNVDDAYAGGEYSGQVLLARDIMAILK